MNLPSLSENLNFSSSVIDCDGEKNPQEISKIEEYKKKLDETTSINRTISESEFSDGLISEQVKNSKKSNSRKIKKADSIHFTGLYTPKQQANNSS